MADTLQAVLWSLERKCIFRSGDGWFLPMSAYRQLADLRTVADAEANHRIVDGICVTGTTGGKDNSGQCHNLPYSGFRVADRIGEYGGLAGALSTCRECEANVAGSHEMKVAGCFGCLSIWPDSSELDERLWQIIRERSLEDRLYSAFLVTTPLWYGFWINSPLQRPQVEVLHEVLTGLCGDSRRIDEDLVPFVKALKVALAWELPLHVSIGPPGHTDFGYYTVFPHCPRCKAEAPVERWKDEYPDEQLDCQVCGQQFNPNEHHSRQPDDFDDDSLERLLGKVGFEEFTKRFLDHRGKTVKQVEEVLDNANHGPLLRRIAEVRKTRESTMRVLRSKPVVKADKLAPSITFALTDDLPLELVLVPAGEFMMGSAEVDDDPTAMPQHLVRFERPFYIGRFPITQAQWAAVIGNNPSRYKDDLDLPVDQVSWFDCQEFCDVLCKRRKRVVRLPSEAEWEYACRAGTTTVYAFGDTLSPEQANFTPFSANPMLGGSFENEKNHDRTTDGQFRFRPTPVGSYPPNAWGIYDLHGNVEEWCEDVWHDNYDGAPSDGTAWLDGEDKTPFRVVRGGWCSATEHACTSAARKQLRVDAGPPSRPTAEKYLDDISFQLAFTPYGFRVVCEVD